MRPSTRAREINLHAIIADKPSAIDRVVQQDEVALTTEQQSEDLFAEVIESAFGTSRHCESTIMRETELRDAREEEANLETDISKEIIDCNEREDQHATMGHDDDDEKAIYGSVTLSSSTSSVGDSEDSGMTTPTQSNTFDATDLEKKISQERATEIACHKETPVQLREREETKEVPALQRTVLVELEEQETIYEWVQSTIQWLLGSASLRILEDSRHGGGKISQIEIAAEAVAAYGLELLRMYTRLWTTRPALTAFVTMQALFAAIPVAVFASALAMWTLCIVCACGTVVVVFALCAGTILTGTLCVTAVLATCAWVWMWAAAVVGTRTLAWASAWEESRTCSGGTEMDADED
ncbi:uncharacterized protein V1518DRAFT_409599 [Limtongia smithiae]|uniref:uncharacterized protein n=1 Tax=Limtongia smithiae TaxID=1125753 RepID=UPI0034CE7F81